MEAALHDGVVPGEVAEGEFVAGFGGDDARVEGELAACADSDGDVGGEGEGEEGEESEREGGIHDVVVVDVVVLACLLACFGLITSAFADWQGAKSDETQGNSSWRWYTKEKCSLSEKKMLGLQRRTKEDIKTFVPHLTRLIWTLSDAPSLTVPG